MDCVYTDTWVDMEFFTNPDYAEKKNQIINMMMPYQIDAALMEGTDTMVFHDMPIHPGYEITQDVMEKHLETILDEAENRRHAEKRPVSLPHHGEIGCLSRVKASAIM